MNTPSTDEQCNGRPSLSGQGTSPQLTLRLPADLRNDAEAAAASTGESLSEWTRDAMRQRLHHCSEPNG